MLLLFVILWQILGAISSVYALVAICVAFFQILSSNTWSQSFLRTCSCVWTKYYFIQYVPKYHQKLGCQANGGARNGHAPPRSANELGCQANGGRAPGAPPPRSANDISSWTIRLKEERTIDDRSMCYTSHHSTITLTMSLPWVTNIEAISGYLEQSGVRFLPLSTGHPVWFL